MHMNKPIIIVNRQENILRKLFNSYMQLFGLFQFLTLITYGQPSFE